MDRKGEVKEIKKMYVCMRYNIKTKGKLIPFVLCCYRLSLLLCSGFTQHFILPHLLRIAA